MSGRGGTVSRAVMVSDILILVVEVVATSSLLARGRTSEVDTVDTDGMHLIQRVYIGTRQRSVIRVTGPNSCHAMKNLNSELLITDIC